MHLSIVSPPHFSHETIKYISLEMLDINMSRYDIVRLVGYIGMGVVGVVGYIVLVSYFVVIFFSGRGKREC